MSYPVIVAYGRTACTRARKGGLHDVHPVDYSAECLKGVIAKVPYVEEHPEIIGDVITGCAMHINQMNMNASRLIVNRAGLPDAVPAQTINRFCSSGLQAIALAANAIAVGQGECYFAGGVESMSKTFKVFPSYEGKCCDEWLNKNYPGAYIVSRYTSFAFLAAYNDMADPSNELLSYIDTINKEITRKRKEFGLEVLEGSDTTLAAKRLREAQELLEATGDSNAAVTEALQVIADAPAGIKSGVETEYLDRIKNATTALQNTDAAKYQTIIGKLTDAINAMISYNIYY